MFQPLNDDQRKLFHKALADWMDDAKGVDFDKMQALREEIAPGEVCSMVRLVRACFEQPHLRARLPAALVALLKERSLLQPCAVVPTLSNAAARP